MPSVKCLPPEKLSRRCDPEQLVFETTAELHHGPEIIGQARAVEAVQFGIGIEHDGYNIYALGPTGTGKQFLVEHALQAQASRRPVPEDLCYVNNFAEATHPKRLSLQAGTGVTLKRDVEQLVEEISTALPAAFESDDYQARRNAIEEEFEQRSETRFAKIQQEAETRGFTMLKTPVGVMFAPIKDNQTMTSEALAELPEDEKQRLQTEVEDLQRALQRALQELPRWQRKRRRQVRQLDRETTEAAIGHLLEELRLKYKALPEIVAFLDAVQQDFTEHGRDLLRAEEKAGNGAQASAAGTLRTSLLLRRYGVNALVDHDEGTGAPVVFEHNPTFHNLIGRIEHISQMGTLVTDFNLIRPGALHRANGGYLILEVRKVLQNAFAWEGLKRALKAKEIRIESLGQALSLTSTVSLEPEPAPLEVKVVLLGDRFVYYLLCALDPEFEELFKVAADFDDVIDRNPQNQQGFVQLIAALVNREKLRPFDRGAVAKVIEQSSRLVGDADKLTARTASIVDLLREADHWAGDSGRDLVNAGDVIRAIEAQVFRSDRLRQRLLDEVLRGSIYIDTGGNSIGQVNGLSVLQLGSFTFGRPNRITARVRIGKGDVIDIEREVDLGGPIHSKGVLILSSFLGAHYAPEQPLSLSASLVFEQSYGGIEGDSASAAELCALLSAIGETPLKQSLAITGSINQHGKIQPIGGVNEKIEGFFDLCKARGLTGDQGVLIPTPNVQHLMLRQDVVEAASADEFHIYPVETIEQCLELLTGLPAGERNADGNYPEGSFNQRVDHRLREMTAKQLSWARAARQEDNDERQA
jgi:lon-related putative ATP-dependent protease